MPRRQLRVIQPERRSRVDKLARAVLDSEAAIGRSMSSMSPLPLFLALALASAATHQEPAAAPAAAVQAPAPFGIELPGGPAGAAWSKASVGLQPARLTTAELAPALDASSGAATWTAWASDLQAEAHAQTADPRRRARLALIALSQGRSDDAWEHLSTLGAAPEWFAAALPALVPGVPLAMLSDNVAGPKIALPDGVLLTPALPPPSRHVSEIVLGIGRIERRAMKAHGVNIGAAHVDITISLEYEGLQVELTHRDGPAVHVKLRLPKPIDFDLAMLYVDWQRQPAADAELDVALAPGSETVTVFARFQPQAVNWPSLAPRELDVRAKEHGFELAIRQGDESFAMIDGFAHGLARLLACPASVVVRDPARAPQPWPGITLDLAANAERERKLRGMISSAEHFALAR
jgi:hypothetical protein